MAAKKHDLVSTAAAAASLDVSVAQFRRLVTERGIHPDKTYTNPHYRSGPPAALWGKGTIARLRRTKALAQARTARGGHPLRDYASTFAKKYTNPSAALGDACEAMFNLNRYTRHASCSDAHRDEILSLKNQLVAHLYAARKYTDRVVKLTKTLRAQICRDCQGAGCERCDDTGEWQEARETASYMFSFSVPRGARRHRYTWMQPDHTLAFEPKVEETRKDDGSTHNLDSAMNISRAKLAEAKALVQYVLTAPSSKGAR